MQLADLAAPLTEKKIVGDSQTEIRGIEYDSRKIEPGFLFAALRGAKDDGHSFIPKAISKGAQALLVEIPVENPAVPQIVVPNSRRALALIANEFYHRPTEKLKVIGVTGTNGKTTTTYLVESILAAAGHKTGIIGTIQYKVGEKSYDCKNTTPESLDLFRLFDEMVSQDVGACAMEVSSHAIVQGRIQGVLFDTVVFTNLTQDHLDYHKTMDEYFEAKAKLFTDLPMTKKPVAVVNADDPYGQKLLKRLKIEARTYGIERGMIQAKNIKMNWKGLSFDAKSPSAAFPVTLKLSGRFNVYNALAAIGAGLALQISTEKIALGLKNAQHVRGRFEMVDKGQDFAVIVDYAHTPDGLLNVLKSARELTKNRLIAVFGCGGDRDRTKRPIMGKIAEEHSDIIVLTSDNPRTEDPRSIIREIEKGIAKPVQVEPDRKAAIGIALALAKSGDTVVIAGKGHETYQIFRDKTIHFDDKEVAGAFLEPHGATQSS